MHQLKAKKIKNDIKDDEKKRFALWTYLFFIYLFVYLFIYLFSSSYSYRCKRLGQIAEAMSIWRVFAGAQYLKKEKPLTEL